MNRIQKRLILGLTVFLAMSFAGISAFAASGNQPPGEPPYGLKIEGGAKGIKLIGVLYVELSSPSGCGYTVLNATVRLRKGADSAAFTTGPLSGCYTLATEGDTQDAILAALSDEVIDYFFPGEDVDIVVKDVSESEQVQGIGTYHFLMDVVLAAQESE